MVSLRHGGSAHRGLGEWLIQRVSALYLAGFSLWLALRLGFRWPEDYIAWKAWLAGGGVRLAFGVFFLSVVLHAWVGMRSVFLDYAKPPWLRFVLQMMTAIGLLALLLWTAEILLIEARP
jgi:succinate dehydrogenase / fumarate reductase membrane anchor subunit